MKKYIIPTIILMILLTAELIMFGIYEVAYKKEITYSSSSPSYTAFDKFSPDKSTPEGKTTSLLLIDSSNEKEISEYAKIQHLNIDKAEKINSHINKETQVYTLSITNTDTAILLNFNKNKLHTLHLKNTSLDDTTKIYEFENLKNLTLNNVSLQDFSCLKNSKIKNLYVYGCDIKDFSWISSLKELEALEISNCNIKDISPLSQCGNLKNITIKNCKIKNIDCLTQLKGLEALDLSHNNISGEVDISELTSLAFLNLSHNKITNIKLSDLGRMISLDLSYNNIEKLDNDFYEQVEDAKKNSSPEINLYGNILKDFSKIKGNSLIHFRDEKYNHYSHEEYEEYINAIENVISKHTNPNWSNEKNAVSVYYYLSKNVEYDREFTDSVELESSSHKSHAAYGALVNKLAVCDGLSYAYQDIMRHIGIECMVYHGDWETDTDNTAHAWNVIKLNGSYYHCDLTWEIGLASHIDGELRNFGQSDDMLKEKLYLLIDKNAPKCPDSLDSERINSILSEITK